MIGGAVVLFVASLGGVFIACHLIGYEITAIPKGVASLLFAVLSSVPLPIPLANIVIPAIALYVGLMDKSNDRESVNKVFGISYIVSILGVMLVYRFIA